MIWLRLHFVTDLRCVVAFVECASWDIVSVAFLLLSGYCVFAKIKFDEEGEMHMANQLPVKQCQYCGSNDISMGWQHGEALVTFKKHGMFGNRLRYLICRRCGAVLYQCVAEPHKFPRVN